MKKLLFLIIAIFTFAFGIIAGSVFAAENPDEIAKKYDITFPIAELGNCTDYSSCRTYCEDPVNSSTCIDFAKKKGFYHEEDIAKTELLAKAKAQLGCSSESSCRELCSKEENFEKCSNFARQNNLSGGHEDDPTSAEILKKAKEILGCSSYSTCMEFCKKGENQDKCSQFARQVGLRGGEHQSGPGGCNSEETCKAFCSDPNNYQVCSGYAKTQGGQFSGPGGCNSEESCRAYCEANKESCMNFGRSQGYNPEEMCRKTPNCSWTNNTCNCSGYGSQVAPTGGYYGQDYCATNPDKCQQNSSQYPTGAYSQPNTSSSNQASECTSKGCYWVSGQNFCDCQNKPYQSSENECKKAGCSWTGSTCDCTANNQSQYQGSYQQYDPATACSQQTGCSWNGSSCQCGSVQGEATSESLLHKVLNFFQKIFP